MGGAKSRAAITTHQTELDEVVASHYNASGMLPGSLTGRLQGRPRTCQRDYVSHLSWPGNAAVSLPRRAEGGGWSLLTLLPLKPSQ